MGRKDYEKKRRLVALFPVCIMLRVAALTVAAAVAWVWWKSDKLETQKMQKISFGAGCFWGVEKWFKKQFPHIQNTMVGYLGGTKDKPSYEQVCTGSTGHAEVLQLEYDDKTKFEDLVTFFFQIHDPTTPNQSGNDRGTQYHSAIFYHTPEQKEIAERIRDEVKNNPKAMKSFHNKVIRSFLDSFWLGLKGSFASKIIQICFLLFSIFFF